MLLVISQIFGFFSTSKYCRFKQLCLVKQRLSKGSSKSEVEFHIDPVFYRRRSHARARTLGVATWRRNFSCAAERSIALFGQMLYRQTSPQNYWQTRNIGLLPGKFRQNLTVEIEYLSRDFASLKLWTVRGEYLMFTL